MYPPPPYCDGKSAEATEGKGVAAFGSNRNSAEALEGKELAEIAKEHDSGDRAWRERRAEGPKASNAETRGMIGYSVLTVKL